MNTMLKILDLLSAASYLIPIPPVLLLQFYYLLGAGQAPNQMPVPVQAGELSAQVNVFNGTGGWPWVCAHNNPSAMTPFGMVRLGPDTTDLPLNKPGLNTSGYYYGDNKTLGFSHTRFIGTGMDDGGNLRVLPVAAAHAEAMLSRPAKRRFTSFSHGAETAFPGYYAVRLPEEKVLAELTATAHCGVHRYTFDAADAGHLFFEVTSSNESSPAIEGTVKVLADQRQIEGVVKLHGGTGVDGGLNLHFVGVFNQPVAQCGVWNGDQFTAGSAEAAGEKIGVDLAFALPVEKPVLELRLGISYVSLANARLNLEAEALERMFEDVVAAAGADWEGRLGAIRVSGGTKKQTRIFYTALFRCFEMPTRFADVNGEYMGFDQQVHKEEKGRYYTDFSLWDTFRTVHPLYSLIAQGDQRDMMASLIEMGKIDKGLPRWPAGTHDTGSMLGTPSDIAVSEAYLKGIRDIDIEAAYALMRQTALSRPEPGARTGGRENIEDYIQYKYCPADKMKEAVARTLEYAWSDYAISQLAGALGKKEDAALFAEHAQYYRNTWNPATQYFQPRDASGGFMEFRPLLLTYMDFRGKWAQAYVEGSAMQWRWGAPFDPEGLISLFKSPAFFERELEGYFSKSRAPMGAWNPGPYYWHGNEPFIHAAYLFNHVGRPDLTQKWVRWICDTMHGDDCIGLAGNDDAATLSAWYVFNALGFYPIAGTTRYELALPVFERAEVKLGEKVLTVTTEHWQPGNDYVKSVSLNGKRLDRTYLLHDEIAGGGTLTFEMAAEGEMGK